MRGALGPILGTFGPLLVLLGVMFAQSFSGVAPARVRVERDVVTITMRGAMPLFALRRRIRLRLSDIATVHADEFAGNLLGGFRIGTSFPKVMFAGWFYRGSRGWDFFAVYRARKALVLDVHPGRRRFRRVIVEVDDLRATAAAVDAARVRS